MASASARRRRSSTTRERAWRVCSCVCRMLSCASSAAKSSSPLAAAIGSAERLGLPNLGGHADAAVTMGCVLDQRDHDPMGSNVPHNGSLMRDIGAAGRKIDGGSGGKTHQQRRPSRDSGRAGAARPCVVRDANMGHHSAGGHISWCPKLESRTTHRAADGHLRLEDGRCHHRPRRRSDDLLVFAGFVVRRRATPPPANPTPSWFGCSSHETGSA